MRKQQGIVWAPLLIIIGVAVVAGIVAYAVIQTNKAGETKNSNTTNDAVVNRANTNAVVNTNMSTNTNISTVPSDWNTYTNTTLSFSLRYPSNWQVTEANNLVSIRGTSNLNANSSTDDIAFTTPGVVIKTQQALFPDDECLIEQTNVNVAGAQRIRQTKGCSYAGSTVATYFQRGNAYVVFSWTTDVPNQYPTYDQILSTFQFTN